VETSFHDGWKFSGGLRRQGYFAEDDQADDETPEERNLRSELEERRRQVDELLPRLQKMKEYVRQNPAMPPEILAQIQETIKASEKFLSDDARERNLGDTN
jgi:hypothetical protein